MAKTHTGRFDIHTVALEPIHHGGGKEGNTNLVRLQTITDPITGQRSKVPFISGNSIRHLIRASAAWYALEAMGIEREWSKGAVDLIFSGGRLTGGGGAYRLDQARRLERLFPITAALGYSAGNYAAPSKISVDMLHIICAENRWRGEDRAPGMHQWSRRAGYFLDEGFGTRHDALKGDAWKLLEGEEAKRLEEAISSGKSKEAKESTQMIYDHQVVSPGSHWYGAISYKRLTDLELAALKSGLENATLCTGPPAEAVFGEGGKGLAPGLVIPVGAMASKGMGKMAWWFNPRRRETVDLSAPAFVDDGSLVLRGDDAPDSPSSLYLDHLREHRDEIVSLLKEMS